MDCVLNRSRSRTVLKQGGPDLRPQWRYTRLYCLASYGVQNLMRGKAGNIRPEAFDSLLREKPYPA